MPIAEQHVLFFGGLVRGAIAWAQVRVRSEGFDVFIACTGCVQFSFAETVVVEARKVWVVRSRRVSLCVRGAYYACAEA